jgi:hypothetical protein
MIAVGNELGDFGRFRDCGRIAAAGDGSERGEDFGMIDSDRPSAVSAHGMAGEIDTVGVHFVGAANIGHDVENVLFGGSTVHGGGFAAFGTGHNVPVFFGQGFEGAVAVGIEHRIFVTAHAVKEHDQRVGFAAVVTGGDKEAVGLQGVIDGRAVGFLDVAVLLGEGVFADDDIR